MTRAWVYSKMTGHSPLTTLVGTRIFESSRLQDVPTKPYVMYKFFPMTAELSGDDAPKVFNQGVQVFVHDVPGDYLRIDAILKILKDLFQNAYDKTAGVEICKWIDSSEDFKDPDMGTITRFARFRIYFKEVA